MDRGVVNTPCVNTLSVNAPAVLTSILIMAGLLGGCETVDQFHDGVTVCFDHPPKDRSIGDCVGDLLPLPVRLQGSFGL